MAIRPTERRPSGPRTHHAALPAAPFAVAEARRQVRAAVRYWHVPVDVDVAALLVSELVTNAVTHDGLPAPGATRAAGGLVTLSIRYGEGDLRVEVYDTSPAPPELGGGVPADAEHGRGLLLIDSLATTWGSFRTTTGKAVYFTLAAADHRP